MDIAKKTQLSSVRVIQVADEPLYPVFPHKIHFILFAIFGGFAAGCGIVVMLELDRRQYARAEDDTDPALESSRLRPMSVFPREAAE